MRLVWLGACSIVDDILNGRDAQVEVDHCIGDKPWGVYSCSQ